MQNKDINIAIIGLGYVGRPLADALEKHFPVIGFDTDPARASSSVHDIASCNVYIIAVPTPLSGDDTPDLSCLLSATRMIGRLLKRNDVVIFESTVYPGCTEEECIPLLEMLSGLRCNVDFGVGYSPERINPGDKKHRLDNVVKIVSASDEATLSVVQEIYGRVVSAGLYVAPSIKVAEAAKLVENTQRDVNIALMNELSLAFDKLGISTDEVVKAASTKWNFHRYSPGLVGGYCIGVSPRYLSYCSSLAGYEMRLVDTACNINNLMAEHVANVVVKHLVSVNCSVDKARLLIMGVTYKENVSDVRNSKAMEVVSELRSLGVKDIVLYDHHALADDVEKYYSLSLSDDIDGRFDAIIVPVSHDEFGDILSQHFIDEHLAPNGILADIKGVCKNTVSGVKTWRL